jgi:hypothetical protein
VSSACGSAARAWSDLSRVGLPWGGEGIRLEASDGRRLEPTELLDGFGVLCDALLLRVPAGLRVDPEASLQLAFARWFKARWFEASWFETGWTVDGRPRLSHGEPRGEDPGYASFRLEGRNVVIVSDAGTMRERLDPWLSGPQGG